LTQKAIFIREARNIKPGNDAERDSNCTLDNLHVLKLAIPAPMVLEQERNLQFTYEYPSPSRNPKATMKQGQNVCENCTESTRGYANNIEGCKPKNSKD